MISSSTTTTPSGMGQKEVPLKIGIELAALHHQGTTMWHSITGTFNINFCAVFALFTTECAYVSQWKQGGSLVPFWSWHSCVHPVSVIR